ncbi:Tyrosine recombinase XerC [Ferriphaselus amnicola]|uniref:Tyrosine recombinase XerC n=1 Tax=Ferriphaselus amnicola TaxID=1188319 RepID=A0A2Z6GCL8_9PROT|nr:site-specific integrase [Ferriphaselus amnicola]BBE51266.1 Tyrosine recombinase XerC [Ferriphaselus amnicola]
MSLFQRKDSPYWWIKIIAHDGRRIQQSTGTADKAKAEEYHDKLKASMWDQARLGVKPRHTWNEAVVRYLAETTHKASQCSDKTHLRWLDRFLNGRMLDEINRELLDSIMAARMAENVKNSSVNRVNEVIRAVLRKASNEWEWLDRVPRIRMLPEPKRRVRWITHDEADRLLTVLPKHLVPMVKFSLETGLRRANVTGLQWSQIDLTRRTAWIHPDQAKARKAIAVPLSAAAVIVIREQIGNHATHVFSYHGNPIVQVNTKAWRKALVAAGIENFRWHDLRHTWASWHVQAGTPLHVLQELGGWECVEMVRKYAHLSSEHLTEYVDRLSSLKLVGNDSGDLATIQLRANK